MSRDEKMYFYLLEVNPNKALINEQTVNLSFKYILSFFIYILFYLH